MPSLDSLTTLAAFRQELVARITAARDALTTGNKTQQNVALAALVEFRDYPSLPSNTLRETAKTVIGDLSLASIGAALDSLASAARRQPAAKQATGAPQLAAAPAPAPPSPAKRKSPPSTALIQCWATDPRDTLALRQVAPPALPGAKLPVALGGPQPAPGLYLTGTPEFRYWVAAEALRRAADFWYAAGCLKWQASVGPTLRVTLDAGNDLNAYYSREPQGVAVPGLAFFHASVADAAHPGSAATVYSGESPDVLTHELGHAVLDALKPELWSIATAEVAGFHESFGDLSALLTALQIPAVRERVVADTQGQLGRNSVLSRLAEELGYAIRQINPKYADADALRNAATFWLYRDPTTLNPDGPNTLLTSEPHNFSRVFTGAFLNALGRLTTVVAGPGPVTADHVLEASQDLGRLVVQAVQQAPLRTRFYQAVAEQLVIAAGRHAKRGPAYVQAITAAMVRHGLLAAPAPAPAALHLASFAQVVALGAVGTNDAGVAEPAATTPTQLPIGGQLLGLATPLLADAPALDEQEAHRPVGILALAAAPSNREQAVQSFVENLARRGRIEPPANAPQAQSFLHQVRSTRHVTHRLEETAAGYVLVRVRVDCSGC